VAALLLCCALSGALVTAAELQVRTLRAYEAYVDEARRLFLARVSADSDQSLQQDLATQAQRLRTGEITVNPAQEDGIISIPGGLVHHWTGSSFIVGATLDDAIALSTKVSDFPTIYKSVKAARLLSRDGDSYRLLLRIHEQTGMVSATLDVWSTVRYVRVDPMRAYSIATASEIREVENAGTPREHLLPPGNDRGYLWRAGTFTTLVERDGGVYVALETLGLSRRFPPMLGWVIEPIARRLGRKSVETSLREFRDALTKAV
jgi:hypothetical protein